jgi:hypothetical protein
MAAMASVVLHPDLQRFPVGTSVGAYARAGLNRSGSPSTSVLETQTVQPDGSLTFTTLSDGTDYVAYASVSSVDTYSQFRSGEASPSSGGSGVDQTARDAAAAKLAKASNLSDLADTGAARANIHSQMLASVRVVATANIAKSGTQTIDGVALVAGDRVLLARQTTSAENGPWVVATGAWTRPTDYPSGFSTLRSRQVLVNEGTDAGSTWTTRSSASRVVDTDATTWAADRRKMTAAAYAALSSKDDTTLYLISG